MKRDFFTQRGAEALAELICSYWRLRGYAGIETRFETAEMADGEHLYFVRSNIGPDGFPPRTEVRRAAA